MNAATDDSRLDAALLLKRFEVGVDGGVREETDRLGDGADGWGSALFQFLDDSLKDALAGRDVGTSKVHGAIVPERTVVPQDLCAIRVAVIFLFVSRRRRSELPR